MIEEKNKILLKLGNITFVLLTIIINALANIIPIGGNLTGDIADSIPNLFVPTGLTFAIWGVIYVLLIVFAIFQLKDLFKKESSKDDSYIDRIGVYFILASIGNVIWIFLWHNKQIILSLLPMVLLFFSLLVIYQRLEIGKKKDTFERKNMCSFTFQCVFWLDHSCNSCKYYSGFS